ncbi:MULTISPECIES: hypothetical protein [Marinobacter]|uniref:hypothetical protein n=1 Tax=Marinobacter TaxID=2742 RepID=UPI00387EA695
MSNHTHLLVTPRTDRALSWFMKALGQRYTQYFNHKHERSGTLTRPLLATWITSRIRIGALKAIGPLWPALPRRAWMI